MLEQILFASGALVIGLIIIAYASFIAKQPVRPKKPKVKKDRPELSEEDLDFIEEQYSDPTWSFLPDNIFHNVYKEYHD